MREAWVARLPMAPLVMTVDGAGSIYVLGLSLNAYGISKHDANGALLWRAYYHEVSYQSAPVLTIDGSGALNIVGAKTSLGEYETIKYDTNGGLLGKVTYAAPDMANLSPVLWSADASGEVTTAGNVAKGGEPDCGVIASFNDDGSLRWRDVFGGEPGQTTVRLSAAVRSVRGDTVVALNRWDPTRAGIVLEQYASSGERRWVADYYAPGNETVTAAAMHMGPNGEIYVAGTAASGATLLKFDAFGKLLWAVPRDFDAAAMSSDPAGNIYLTAWHGTAKLAPNGQQLWIANGYYGTSILLDAAGGVYALGAGQSLSGYGDDLLTMQHDSDGNRTWMARYNSISDETEAPVTMTLDAKGNLIVLGRSGGAGVLVKYEPKDAGAVPKILEPPHSEVAFCGSSAQFSVSATGPALGFQWFSEGNSLPAQTNSTLPISGLTLGNAGLYWVEVSNPYGTVATIAARLTVNTPPVITAHPGSTWALTGATTSFSGYASGTEPMVLHWQYEGVPIQGTTKSSLTLTNIELGQAGGYALVASNDFGSVTSRVAFLSITTPLPARFRTFFGNEVLAFMPALGLCSTGSGGTSRFDADGERLWRLESPAGVAIAVSARTNIIVTSSSVTTSLDPEGNTIWSHAEMGGVQVCEDNAGNIVLARPGVTSPYPHDFWVGKFDTNGSPLWNPPSIHPAMGIPRALASDRFGNVFVAGDGFLLIKYSPRGELLWATEDDFFLAQASSLAVDEAGNVYVSGVRDWGGDPIGLSSCWVSKYSPTGRRLWSVSPTTSGSSAPSATALVSDPRGGVYGTCDGRATFRISAQGVVLWKRAGGGNSIASDGNGRIYCLSSEHGSLIQIFETNLPPAIIHPPVSQAVLPGESVTLHTEALGSGPLYYQWRRNGYILPGATNANLVLPVFHPELAGEYSVDVRNAFGTQLSANAELTIDARRLLIATVPSADELGIKLNAPTNRQFLIEASTNLVNWQPVLQVHHSQNPELLQFPLETNRPERYFRATELP